MSKKIGDLGGMLRATPAYLKSLSPQLLKGERNRELLASG